MEPNCNKSLKMYPTWHLIRDVPVITSFCTVYKISNRRIQKQEQGYFKKENSKGCCQQLSENKIRSVLLPARAMTV